MNLSGLEKSSLYLRKPKFLIFPEMELSSPRIKNFLIVSSFSVQNFSLKIFLTFVPRKTRVLKEFLIFSQKTLFLYFGRRQFLASNLKIVLIFQQCFCKA